MGGVPGTTYFPLTRDLDLDNHDVLNVGSISGVDLDLSGTLTVDTINEHTGAAGVTVEGVLMRDAGTRWLVAGTYAGLAVNVVSHDAVHLYFDAYLDGAPRSSDAGSNFEVVKTADALYFRYDTGITPGNVITWNNGCRMKSDGTWDCYGAITVDTINEHTGAAGVTIDSVVLKDNTVTATHVYVTNNGTMGLAGEGIFTFSDQGTVTLSSAHLAISGINELRFFDPEVNIASLDDGHLDLTADVSIDFNSPAGVVPDNFTLGLSGGGHIEWDNQATDEINFISCRVGVGTQAPGYDLHVYSASTTAALKIETDADAYANLFIDGARTANNEIGTVTFLNSGDSVAQIAAARVGANDAASLAFKTQAAGGGLTTRMTLGTTGDLTLTGVILGPDGAAGAPAYSFAADTDTGIHRAAAADIALVFRIGAGVIVRLSDSGTQRCYGNWRIRDDSQWLGLGSGTDADSPDATIYYNATNLVIDPDVIGTGVVLIGATGDDDLQLSTLTVGGDIVMAEDAWIGITGPAERLVFDGSDGLITVTDSHLRLDSTNQVQWNAATEAISSKAPGMVDYDAATEHHFDSGDVHIDGSVGIGSATVANQKLKVVVTHTADPGGDIRAVYLSPTLSYTAAANRTNYGYAERMIWNGDKNGRTITNLGYFCEVWVRSACTNAHGVQALVDAEYAGVATLDAAIGLRARVRSSHADKTITNAYGAYVNILQTAGTITTGYLYYGESDGNPGTNWGLYLTGETKNYFSGDVGIGDTTPSYKLDVNGTGRFVNQLNCDGIIEMVASTSSAGHITQAGTRLLHTYGTNNLFVGSGAGNFTLTGNTNVGIGGLTLDALTSGTAHVAIGYQALSAMTAGTNCIAIGYQSLLLTTGNANIGIGYQTLVANTVGVGNFAMGHLAATATTGSYNFAAGFEALTANVGGGYNVAIGPYALHDSTATSSNVAIGYVSLAVCNGGIENVAVGAYSLGAVTANSYCTAVGHRALQQNTGAFNTAVGRWALTSAGAGGLNTAVGVGCLWAVTSGTNNTAIGVNSGYATTTGVGGVFLGNYAGYYETAGAKLFVDNVQRASEADARVKALIYGVFNAAVDSQLLRVNAPVEFLAGQVVDQVTKVANYTATAGDYVVLCDTDTAAAGFTITLPAAASHTGRVYYVKNTGTGHFDVTVDGDGAETIDGAATQTVIDGNCLAIVCDGTEWWVI